MFAAAGYKTGLFGKWHLGDHYPHRPNDKGFQEAAYHLGFGMLNAAPEFDNPLFDGRYFHNAEPKRFTGHCTDLWFDSATAWMKQRHEKGEPFYCYLATNAPHVPHVERLEFVEPYEGTGPATFFGMIAHVDQRFGQLDEFLTASGLRENTLVIFMTDNGGTAGVNLYNAGLRGRKTTYYEGGHRVPCWMRWPAGNLGPARDVADPAQVQDLLSTLLELCDVPKAAEAKFDGVSLAGLLRGTQAALPERKFVVQYSRDQVAKWDACVVWGKWRLVHGKELFDAEADRAQVTDVAARHPDVVKAMRDHYEAWWAGIEPKVNEYVPAAYLGSGAEPVVELTSADWEGIYADNGRHIRTAVGGPRGGHWNVMVEKAGEYEIALRRWPRDTNAALGSTHDRDPKLAGAEEKKPPPPSKAFPIAAAKVEVVGREASAKTDPMAQEVVLRVSLPAGKTTLRGWFQDADGNDLCGAFFAYVRHVR